MTGDRSVDDDRAPDDARRAGDAPVGDDAADDTPAEDVGAHGDPPLPDAAGDGGPSLDGPRAEIPERLDDRWVAEHLPPRPDRAHKGTFGRLMVIAGSPEYPGAALLTGLGALRMGAGLVAVAAPESLHLQLVGAVPELTWLALSEEAPGVSGPGGWRRMTAEASRYDAIVLGPGLGANPTAWRRARRFLAEIRRPVVVDADGLNALAEEHEWWRLIGVPAVLAPHPGEFARLRGDTSVIADDDAVRTEAAALSSRTWGHVVALKGANTVVAAPDGRTLMSCVATPALATAGSGDVLAGAIGALLAAGLEPFSAAACAVAVHARAGVICEERVGRAGVLASEIAAAIPAALRAIGAARST